VARERAARDLVLASVTIAGTLQIEKPALAA
jgi:hypothetical protein